MSDSRVSLTNFINVNDLQSCVYIGDVARDNAFVYLPWPIEIPKVAKASTIVSLSRHYHLKFNANVNDL